MQRNGKAQGWRPTSSDFTGVPEMLTAKDLEALLKIDTKTIYSYVQKGLIPYVRIQSNVRFIRHQIAEWIEGKTFSPRPMNGDSSNNR
jgi:predicted DNA-binding transcriptional regulator AlpA